MPAPITRDPLPTELQQYPRATMSERYANSIIPPPRLSVADRLTPLQLEQLQADRRRIERVEQSIRERVTTNAGRRMMEIPPLREGFGTELATHVRDHSCLIQVPKAPTSESLEVLPAADLIDDTRDGVSDRLARYTVGRLRALEMAAYLRTIDPTSRLAAGRDVLHLADKLERCGEWLEFRDFAPAGLAETRLSAGSFCNLYRLDPLCAIRRAARWLRQIAGPVVAIAVDQLRNNPDAVLCLTTYTVKSGRFLGHRLDHLIDCWRKECTNRRSYLAWKRTGRGKPYRFRELSGSLGCLYAVEIKRGRNSGGWHPHLHAVQLFESMPDQSKMRAEWEERTGDSFMVDCRPFHCMSKLGMAADLTPYELCDLIAGDLAELCKYALKFGDLSLRDNWRAELVMQGRRLRGGFGLFHGMNPPDDLLDAPLEVDDLPYLVHVAKWKGEAYEVHTSGVVQPNGYECEVPF